ncbi:MAG: hypothetical protein NC093_01155 [Alistipes sp.]|nr:hypothetical protein [Alistipes sp.]
MAYCTKCGMELDENGNCFCTQLDPVEEEKILADKEEERKIKEKEKAEKKAQKKAERAEKRKKKEAPELDGLPADDPEVILAKHRDFRSKMNRILAAVIVCVLAVLLIFLGFGSLTGAYKKPIKSMIKAINKEDASYAVEAMFNEVSEGVMRNRASESGIDWDMYLDVTNGFIKKAKKDAKIKKVSADIVARQRLAGSNLKKVEDFYEEKYGIEVKKAYEVEVEFTLKKKNGSEDTVTAWLCVAKLKDGGWKYCPECTEFESDDFGFIEAAARFK